MLPFIRWFRHGLAVMLRTRLLLPRLTLGRLFACVSILGLVTMSYLLGAAVIHFKLPSSGFLDQAFLGAEALYQREQARAVQPVTSAGEIERTRIVADTPERTYDGFTLYTTTADTRARLIDMAGNVIHEWAMPFRKAWPQAPHVREWITPLAHTTLAQPRVHWFDSYLYPNGDLLAIYHAEGDTPYGYGLAKLDKDSNLLWAYSDNVHHALDVTDDGLIYTLTQKLVSKAPAGLEFVPTPYIEDALVVLSPEGRELETLSILEAFRDSPYAALLGSLRQPDGDILHTNAVKVLRRELAPHFPLFKEGQVLISLRTLDALAVIDPRTRSVVWAVRGAWKAQHDPEWLDNGHLLVFDNRGSGQGTRVLEYDPVTQALPWVYANEDAPSFTAQARGRKQRLPNGNTLIVDPDHRRLFEVTAGKTRVWETICPVSPVLQEQGLLQDRITSGRRYGSDELTFLKGDVRARP